MLDAHRQAHHALGHAGLLQFFRPELAVGGGGRVRGQRASIADVYEPREELQGIEEARAGRAGIGARYGPQLERENAGGPAAEQALRDRMVGVAGQGGVPHLRHLGVLLQVVRDGQRVVTDAVHAQCQGFDALQDQEGVVRGERGAGVAQRHDARAADEGCLAQGFGIDHAVVAGVGGVEAGEALLVLRPGELATVHDGAADAVAVAAQVLGERVDDDVRAVLDGAQQVGAGHGVVHDQRHAVVVRHTRQRGDVGHVAQRVADGFDENGLGAAIDVPREAGRVARVREAGGNALARQRVREQVVGAAIERAGRYDVVAGLGDGLDRVGDGRHARGQGQRGDAAFERRDALFEHVVGGIHDAGVDVARHLQVEQVRSVLGAVEGVGRCLVDGHRHGAGGGVGCLSGVDGEGLDLHAVLSPRKLWAGRRCGACGPLCRAATPRGTNRSLCAYAFHASAARRPPWTVRGRARRLLAAPARATSPRRRGRFPMDRNVAPGAPRA